MFYVSIRPLPFLFTLVLLAGCSQDPVAPDGNDPPGWPLLGSSYSWNQLDTECDRRFFCNVAVSVNSQNEIHLLANGPDHRILQTAEISSEDYETTVTLFATVFERQIPHEGCDPAAVVYETLTRFQGDAGDLRSIHGCEDADVQAVRRWVVELLARYLPDPFGVD